MSVSLRACSRRLKQAATVSAASLALVGGALAVAPAASAVGSSACTDGRPFVDSPWPGHVTAGPVNLRTSPTTKSSSKGLVSKGTKVGILCSKGEVPTSWDYVKVKTGAHAGTYGWIYDKYVNWDRN